MASKRTPKKPKLINETTVQRTICDYLSANGYFFFRNNNTPIYDATRKVFRAMPKYCMKGISDIIIIKPSGSSDGAYVIFLEVKNPNRKTGLSEHQLAFKAMCNKVHAEFHMVRSLDEVIALGF